MKLQGPAARPVDLTFLHTAQVHVATFDDLVHELAPGCRVTHLVRPDLLADAQRWGAEDPRVVRGTEDALRAAGQCGARAVVCTCSTLGPIAERLPAEPGYTVARLDRAMADQAVALGPDVLVVVALPATLTSTLALLESSALQLHRPLRLRSLVVEQAWSHFLAGDTAAYAATIAATVRADTGPRDAVVLAQASMVPAQVLLADLGAPVFTSPRAGVELAIKQLGASPRMTS